MPTQLLQPTTTHTTTNNSNTTHSIHESYNSTSSLLTCYSSNSFSSKRISFINDEFITYNSLTSTSTLSLYSIFVANYKSLPNELWMAILLLLPAEEVAANISGVNKFFYKICNDELLWRSLFYTRFGTKVILRSQYQNSAALQTSLHSTQPPLSLSSTSANFWKKEYIWRQDVRNRVLYFNLYPVKCLKSMARDGLLKSEEDIAYFLKRKDLPLSKRQIGNLLGRLEEYDVSFFPKQNENNDKTQDNSVTNLSSTTTTTTTSYCSSLRTTFLNSFDFDGIGFVEALRMFLKTLHLPGNAQPIDRLMYAFAERYYNSTGKDSKYFQSEERIYLLAFSTIMLNTDLHNSSIKRKMPKKSFISGNSCPLYFQNDAGFISFLKRVYDDIQLHELAVGDGYFVDIDPRFTDRVKEGWIYIDVQELEATKSKNKAKKKSKILSLSSLKKKKNKLQKKWCILTSRALFVCETLDSAVRPIYTIPISAHQNEISIIEVKWKDRNGFAIEWNNKEINLAASGDFNDELNNNFNNNNKNDASEGYFSDEQAAIQSNFIEDSQATLPNSSKLDQVDDNIIYSSDYKQELSLETSYSSNSNSKDHNESKIIQIFICENKAEADSWLAAINGADDLEFWKLFIEEENYFKDTKEN